MTDTLAKKTWGEREGVTLEVLKKFTKPGDPQFGEVFTTWNYRGDFTESGEKHLRNLVGNEIYQHLNWDTVATNKGVFVVVPRWKAVPEREGNLSFMPPVYWWAMESVADPASNTGGGIRPCTDLEIAQVVPESQDLLSSLPGLEFMHIEKVSYFSSDNPGEKRWKDAPRNARFFRFAAGFGCVAITPHSKS